MHLGEGKDEDEGESKSKGKGDGESKQIRTGNATDAPAPTEAPEDIDTAPLAPRWLELSGAVAMDKSPLPRAPEPVASVRAPPSPAEFAPAVTVTPPLASVLVPVPAEMDIVPAAPLALPPVASFTSPDAPLLACPVLSVAAPLADPLLVLIMRSPPVPCSLKPD